VAALDILIRMSRNNNKALLDDYFTWLRYQGSSLGCRLDAQHRGDLCKAGPLLVDRGGQIGG
jgi:hypothetical protein